MSIVLSLEIWNTSVRGMKHVNMSGGLTGYYCKVSFIIWTMEMSGKYLSLVSQVAQTIKNMPEMQETWAWSLGLRSPGGEHGNPLQYSCLENPHWERSLVATVQCHKEWDMTEQLTLLLLSLQTFRYTRNDLGQCFILWKERLLWL